MADLSYQHPDGASLIPTAPSPILSMDASKSNWVHTGEYPSFGYMIPGFGQASYQLLGAVGHPPGSFSTPPEGQGQVTIQCNNLSVVTYINRMGGTRRSSLYLQTIKLLVWCLCHRNKLRVVHLPGADNILADQTPSPGGGRPVWVLPKSVDHWWSST